MAGAVGAGHVHAGVVVRLEVPLTALYRLTVLVLPTDVYGTPHATHALAYGIWGFTGFS